MYTHTKAIDLNVGDKVRMFLDASEWTVLSNYPTGYGWTELTFGKTSNSANTCDAVVKVPLEQLFPRIP